MLGESEHSGHNFQSSNIMNCCSFHEMGVNDLAAAIDYILDVTNSSQLIYIGHSQGTTMFYTLMSTKPEYNAKVKLHVGLAPVATLAHTRSAFRLLVPFAKQIQVRFAD